MEKSAVWGFDKTMLIHSKQDNNVSERISIGNVVLCKKWRKKKRKHCIQLLNQEKTSNNIDAFDKDAAKIILYTSRQERAFINWKKMAGERKVEAERTSYY